MPTIGAFAQLIPVGFRTRPYRATDATVFACLDGTGEANIGGRALEFAQNDVFVVPSWCDISIKAKGETVLFSFSDRPVQQMLGLWREQKS
jgi:gentisate 1,2-dioxygenase